MTCVCWMPWGPENFFYQHIYFISKPLTHTFLYCFWNVLWAKFLQKFFDVKIFRYFSQTATRINESTSASRWHYSNYTGKGCYELKVAFNKVFKCKHFQTLFTKSKSLSHFGITRITLEKDGLCGNLCHLAASLPQTYVLFKAFKLSPVKHSSAFSFHDNLPFINQPAASNFLLSPKKSLKSNSIRIPGLMCCFSAESKNIH